ncbi:hypothetical protein NQ314_003455 [Rhamnusium bicolor]|uniref:Uncharacterized protein n=1 Tax=Rhamnusium bicolor TaxID=1586634 RepID=A0AAV8ZNK7_9CUCU|nr:hypothetical protein NQ314_003455 [Rhamnusium bicolor]
MGIISETRFKYLGDGPRGSLRIRRQTELDDVDNRADDGTVAEQNEGFFDRAAKFVVDLLQRFLKWINSDSN